MSHVAQSCYGVIGDKPLKYGARRTANNFVLLQLIIYSKLGVIDRVRDPYWRSNFS